jgi:hypothetical protein
MCVCVCARVERAAAAEWRGKSQNLPTSARLLSRHGMPAIYTFSRARCDVPLRAFDRKVIYIGAHGLGWRRSNDLFFEKFPLNGFLRHLCVKFEIIK